MINNGFIEFEISVGGGFDSSGNPIAPTVSLSEKVSCNIKKIAKEYKTLVSETYLQGRYSVTVDKSLITVDYYSVKRANLYDLNNNLIGNYLIHDFEPYGLITSYRIICGDKK